ncbi:hypothetical protein O6H91_Y223300 [Diphasiastrum complanatum]|nr:hypothetical protein O6H91_Y223300 [Diphasiastrum complanatum]
MAFSPCMHIGTSIGRHTIIHHFFLGGPSLFIFGISPSLDREQQAALWIVSSRRVSLPLWIPSSRQLSLSLYTNFCNFLEKINQRHLELVFRRKYAAISKKKLFRIMEIFYTISSNKTNTCFLSTFDIIFSSFLTCTYTTCSLYRSLICVHIVVLLTLNKSNTM